MVNKMINVEKIVDFISSPKFYVPIIVVLSCYLLMNILSRAIKRMLIANTNKLEDKKRNTIVVLISSVLKYVLILVGLCIILATYGVNVKGILAGLGIAGAIAGLAFQDMLKDIISGCNIIMDNYFIIGDLVQINDFIGYVVGLGLKNTKVRDFDGNILIISNREISHVINMSQKHASIPIMVDVAYEETEENVKKSLLKAIVKINKLPNIVKPCEYLGIESMNDSSVTYIFRVHAKPDFKFDMKRKVFGIVKDQFDKDGIKIPYPQVEVHNGKKL